MTDVFLTYEETQLTALYLGRDRLSTMEVLGDILPWLDEDMRLVAASALCKLGSMSDEAFRALDIRPEEYGWPEDDPDS